MNYQNPKRTSIGQFFAILFIAIFSGLLGGLIMWGIFHFDQSVLPESWQSKEPLYTESTANFRMQQASMAARVDESRRNAIVRAAEIVEPAVVTVVATHTRYYRRYDYYFDYFFGNMPRVYREKIPSLGSGFIISQDGYILTNQHVVDKAEEISVVLPDSREFDAILIGEDAASDIAVLKINGDDLPAVVLGDSNDIIIGEWAIAIGNPFGNWLNDPNPTVTVGVISATRRDFKPEKADDRAYKEMIQTDAAINPGNSGGPLVNSLGEVIGINTFIFTESGGNIGIGFAIPINHAKQIFEEIIAYGDVREVWVGLEVQAIAPALAQYLGLKDRRGLIVVRVERGSSADLAGFEVADILRRIDQTEIISYEDADVAFTGKRVGDTVTCTIERDGQTRQLTMTLIGLPEQ